MTHGELVDLLSKYSFDKKVYVFQEFATEYEEDLDGSYCEPTVKDGWIDDKGLVHINYTPDNSEHVIIIWS